MKIDPEFQRKSFIMHFYNQLTIGDNEWIKINLAFQLLFLVEQMELQII